MKYFCNFYQKMSLLTYLHMNAFNIFNRLI